MKKLTVALSILIALVMPAIEIGIFASESLDQIETTLVSLPVGFVSLFGCGGFFLLACHRAQWDKPRGGYAFVALSMMFFCTGYAFLYGVLLPSSDMARTAFFLPLVGALYILLNPPWADRMGFNQKKNWYPFCLSGHG